MKLGKFKVALLAYALFDLLIGGSTAGILPLTLATGLTAQTVISEKPSSAGRLGRVSVNDYYGYKFQLSSAISSGSQSVTLVPYNTYSIAAQNGSCLVTFGNGRSGLPFAVGTRLLINDSASETITVTSITTTNSICSITATFASAHNAGAAVQSGSFGIDEAVRDIATLPTGGMVTIPPDWGGTTALIAATTPYANVGIEDLRGGAAIQYWNVTPASLSFLAVPTTLTAVTALPSATPVGTYGTGTYHLCIAYVDIMGNEGPCSADFSEAGLATGSFIFSAPAASTGAVGYTIYISLTAGSYAFSYKVPLTSSICALTTVETTTAACAVANTNYGQSGATATVTAITVNTARLAAQLGAASSTTDYVPNSNSHTVYAYVPSNRLGIPGVVASSLPFTVTTAAGTTVPAVMGTIHLPANFMNYIGKTIRICGLAKEASAGSTSTVTSIQFWWDADGSNAAGVPVNLGGPTVTATLVTANADQWKFCQDLKTTVAGAGATAGSIVAGQGELIESYGAATTVAAASGPTIGAAAVASLNLAGEARIDVVYLHTTNTDGAGVILQDLTVETLN
jgi:hypothetical protein